jgi:hypothetical protein
MGKNEIMNIFGWLNPTKNDAIKDGSEIHGGRGCLASPGRRKLITLFTKFSNQVRTFHNLQYFQRGILDQISYEKGGKINVKSIANHFFRFPFHATFVLENTSGFCSYTRANTFWLAGERIEVVQYWFTAALKFSLLPFRRNYCFFRQMFEYFTSVYSMWILITTVLH